MGQAKRNQLRDCPALGTTLTATTCATDRNREINCPGSCPHNPFNPEHYLTSYQVLEAAAVKNLSFMLYRDPDFKQLARIRNSVMAQETLRANALHVWHIHGENRVAKWLAQGAFRSWKNDDLVMALSLDTIRSVVLEVQCVIDNLTLLVRDLLRPDEPPFVMIDASTAAKASRFDVYLTWVYAIPGGLHRLSGAAQVVPDFGTMSHYEAFEILLKHLGAPDTAREKWLLEMMPRLSEALSATQIARTVRQYEMSDIVLYERACRFGGKEALPDAHMFTDLIAKLQQHPLVNDDGHRDPGAIFQASLLTEPASGTHPVESVGTLAIYPDAVIQLSSVGRENSAALLDFIKKLEPSCAIIKETLNDLGKQQIQDMGYWDPALVPPALLENASKIELRSSLIPTHGDENPLKSSFEGFSDIPIPVLDNRTPRDAATDPIMRPRLLELMKSQVHTVDQQRRSQGVDFDINPLLKALGLVEIIQPPSPCGGVIWDKTKELRTPIRRANGESMS